MVAVGFALLAAAFFFRFLEFGYKWLRHTVEDGANFKVLTCWALLYVVVCGAISGVAFLLPRADRRAGDQNGERGT
jgi:hypothetical protein